MRRARSRPPQDRGREDGSQKGVGNVDAENGRSKQDDRATKPVRFWIHVTGTGARRTEGYAVLDGDGVEDGESEVMTQDDEQREQRESLREMRVTWRAAVQCLGQVPMAKEVSFVGRTNHIRFSHIATKGNNLTEVLLPLRGKGLI